MKKLTILGYVLVAFVAGGLGSAAQTVVFQKAKFLATSTAADAIQSRGGITAGSGNVAIVSTAGKIPALSSTYFASLSGANLTALPSGQLVGTIDNGVQDLITRLGTIVSGVWHGTAITGTYITTLLGALTGGYSCDNTYTAATDLELHVTVGSSGAASVTTEGITFFAGGSGVGGGRDMTIKKGQDWIVNLNGGSCGTDVAFYTRTIGG
jgi:hypothetical protein